MSLLKLYQNFDLEIDRAKGIKIFAKNGKEYLDTFTGIGVLSFGHSHPDLIKVFTEKLERYSHLSNFFIDEDAEYVAEKLIEFTGTTGKVFYTNSGTEASEGVLKTIRKISTPKRNQIIFFDKGFHGRTTGSLSVTGFPKIKNCFEPLLQHTCQLPFNDSENLEKHLNKYHDQVIAVFVEAIQGSGGIVPLDKGFAKKLEELHQKYKFVLICDEIQAGLGRTGKLFAYQHFGLKPNLVTVAKSLGGGLPLGAILFLENYADVLQQGEHGSTFAPNPVALAGAKYDINHIPKMLPDITQKGEYFLHKIKRLNSDRIQEARGYGLMLAIELIEADETLRDRAFDNQLLLNVINNKIIRLLPALNITQAEMDLIVQKIGEIL